MTWSGRFDDFSSLPSLNSGSHRNFKSVPVAGSSISTETTGIVKIESLCSGILNGTIVGVILAKESPRSVFSRKNPGTERHLLSFVIRDSPTFHIQATCWGSDNHISDLAKDFHVGDIVQLQNVQVQVKSDDCFDKFRPCTPSPYILNVSENYSSTSLYNGPDKNSYSELLHLPTKPNNDYYTLEDIMVNGQNLHGEHINILAAVRSIGPVKDITTKTGKHTQRCELKLFDETYQSFSLILWDSEVIDMSKNWMPFDTVIFVADVRASYDNFRSGMVSTADSKTIFTVNPDTLEAHSLYQFAQSQSFLGTDANNDGAFRKEDPDLTTITDVFSVEKIVSSQLQMKNSLEPVTYGIVYAFLTQFDADCDSNHWVCYQCSKCHQRVREDKGFLCGNAECTQGVLNMFDTPGTSGTIQPVADFFIKLSMSDHSGTISQCHMTGSVVEKFISCKPEEFLTIPFSKKTELKWKYLLERCKIYFKLTKNLKTSGTSVRILHCELASPSDVCKNLQA